MASGWHPVNTEVDIALAECRLIKFIGAKTQDGTGIHAIDQFSLVI
jgi:hypothetical protein